MCQDTPQQVPHTYAYIDPPPEAPHGDRPAPGTAQEPVADSDSTLGEAEEDDHAEPFRAAGEVFQDLLYRQMRCLAHQMVVIPKTVG